MSTTKNETSPALQVLADITKIPAEFLLKENAVMLNVPSVLKAMENFAELATTKMANLIESAESLDNSIPVPSEDNLEFVKGEFVWIDKQTLRVAFVEHGAGRWVVARRLHPNESIDDSIPVPGKESANERSAEEVLAEVSGYPLNHDDQFFTDDALKAMILFGKQCYDAGERARDHYYNDRNSDVTRKKIGYLFFEDYIIHLKSKK